MCYLSMIRSAKKTIRIQSPYFIPDSSVAGRAENSGSGGRENQAYDSGSEGKHFFWILLQIIFADSFWNMEWRYINTKATSMPRLW